MEDLLPGGLSISQKKINSFAAESTRAQCRCQPMGYTHEMNERLGIGIRQGRRVMVRYDQRVSLIDRLDVHKGGAAIVAVQETCRLTAIENSAKYAWTI